MKLKLYFVITNHKERTSYTVARIIFLLNSKYENMIINKTNFVKKIIWFSTFLCGVELMFSIILQTQWNEINTKKNHNKELKYQ